MIVAVLVMATVIFGIYALVFYRADSEAVAVIKENNDGFSVEDQGSFYIFKPDNATNAGFVFYPGGKVECEAYAPLLGRLADNGITCILLKMPANLAVLSLDAASGIKNVIPGIERWFIGGHSLGGLTAGKYLDISNDVYEGIILLGSYLDDDLSDRNMRALLIYGSEDKVMDMDRFEKSLKYLPVVSTKHIIEGGCHSYFGSYGIQKGDGTPYITREEQCEKTVDWIVEFIFGK